MKKLITIFVVLVVVFSIYFIATIKYAITQVDTFSSSDSAKITTVTHKAWVNKDGFRIGY